MDDMKAKGRERKASGERHGTKVKPHTVRRGSNHGMSKLNEQKVKEIRFKYASGRLQQELADEYNVVQTIISRVVRRETWAHVP